MTSLYEKVANRACLETAWATVKAKRPPPGIDRVRWEDFDVHAEQNLERLAQELTEGRYRHLPVMGFERRRGDKKPRQVGIATMRDRVVQQALAQVLTPVLEGLLLPCCYAYRPGRSAVGAVRHAAKVIGEGYLWALQMDIHDFFDSIDHERLLQLLFKLTGDAAVVKLVSTMVRARVFKQMGLFDHLCGTHQGSGISPLLSNLYLHPLDRYLWSRHQERYLRYSDDLILFAKEREILEQACLEIPQALKELKLAVCEDKTSVRHVSEGIVYLGYHMDSSGVGPSRKSVETLEERLRAFDRVRPMDSVAEKLAEATRLVRGWRAYYADCTVVTPPNAIAFLAWSDVVQEDGHAATVRSRLKDFGPETYQNADVGVHIGNLCLTLGLPNQAVRHFARSLELDPECTAAKERIRRLQNETKSPLEVIAKTRLVLQSRPDWREGYEKLRDEYVRLGLYGFAQKAHDKVLSLDDTLSPGPMEASTTEPVIQETAAFDYRTVDQDLFLRVFEGRLEAHAKQWVDESGRWGFVRVERPLKKRDIYKHLKGEETLAVYPVTATDAVNFLVFDVDTAKKAILQHGEAALDEFRRQAHHDALRLKHLCANLGCRLYLEDSGYKGRHGWLFFDKPIEAGRAMCLGRQIMQTAGGPSPSMVWELYPMGKSQRHQSLIKLPLGINQKSKRRCLFVKDDGDPVEDQGLVLKTIERASFDDVSERLSRLRHLEEPPASATPDREAWDVSPPLQTMISRCGVLRHLIDKAKATHYLTHFERVCLLYTLTFAGAEGEAYLHRVIAYCLNYSRAYTQRQIDQRKDSPISCARIMELFPELTEALPCACDLKPPVRGYPSPVLHMLAAEIQAASAPSEATLAREDDEHSPKEFEALAVFGTQAEDGKEEPVAMGALLDFEHLFQAEAGDAPATLFNEPIEAADASPGEPEIQASEAPPPARKPRCQPPCPGPSQNIQARVSALALEYCRLQEFVLRRRQRLQELGEALDEIFGPMQERCIDTPVGEISWVRDASGIPTLTMRWNR